MLPWGGVDLVQEMMEEANERPGAALCWSAIGNREIAGEAIVRSLYLGFDDEPDKCHVRVALAPSVLNGEVVIRARRFECPDPSRVQLESEAWAETAARAAGVAPVLHPAARYGAPAG